MVFVGYELMVLDVLVPPNLIPFPFSTLSRSNLLTGGTARQDCD